MRGVTGKSGVAEHVASGERRVIRNMDDVTAFVQPYIEAMDRIR